MTNDEWSYLKSQVVFSILVGVGLLAVGCRTSVPKENAETATSALRLDLPARARVFPAAPDEGATNGFKFRGTKGWAWTPDQYLEEIPWLARFRMNFLMNCYVSLFASTHPWVNEWWKPLSDSTKASYGEVIRACRTNGIIFCFCMNPQLDSQRPLNASSGEDLDLLYQHYFWAQGQGVRWFSICVDDVKWTQAPTMVASNDAKMVNTILNRLRQKDPGAQMIFCAGPYHGNGMRPGDHEYLQTLGREMDPEVYVFWTGDGVVTHRITHAAAASYKQAVNHRLFIWDNYPVNDGVPTLHLGPLNGRAPDLCDVADGYMSNPMGLQNEINRLPLATCADYAANPGAYDPSESIGQAVRLLGHNRAQREVLRQLVEAYPGFLAAGGGTGSNAVRARFNALRAKSGAPAADRFRQQIQDLGGRLGRAFPGQFNDAKKSVAEDVAWMKGQG